ncbi:translocation protein SEC63 homolog [Clavelina lepadiformis]|uniref:translocation protein SEC63 homolog n=1 Tax=Clavelina lepadiformis TaxID=159417 RepID=UPI0040412241
MAQRFTYDEKGSTFLYFLLSFFAMILIPFTFFMWPKGVKDEEKRLRNQCRIHGKSKWYKKEQDNFRKKKSKPNLRKIFLLLCWVGFFVLVYKVSNIEHDFVEYDPYEVLSIDREASKIEIKKRYRQLSLENHPDKGGSSEMFMKIRKAYEALTDEETMKNWKEHGNPDGPQAMEFGIALPKWIVESHNSIFVLGIYVVLLMIVLPTIVGIWWNRSIKYSKEEVLLNTTQLYYYFFNKTPNMNLKRAQMVLSASFEFCREYNSEVRASTPKDNEDIPDLIRTLELMSISENAKERPLNFPYSVKARVLMYCHLCHIEMPSAELEVDLEYILSKTPLLVQEMVSCIAQLTVYAHWNKASMPRLESLENVMKMCPMMVQGLRETKSPLLQLPYFNEDFVKFCHMHKKATVRNLRSLAMLKDSERRQVLRRMGDEEYETLVTVMKSFPDVEIHAEMVVMDDEDKNVITAGAIVTVTLTMIRRSLGDLNDEDENGNRESRSAGVEDDVEDENSEQQQQQVKLKPWEKQKKKKNVKKKKAAKGGKKTAKKVEKQKPESVAGEGESSNARRDNDSSHSEEERDDESEDEAPAATSNDEEREEQEWREMQAAAKKKEQIALSGSKRTHTVYAPMFPTEKQEWWWAYICDRKHHLLLTAPVLITNLIDDATIDMKFPAPQKPGRYTYTVWFRSDSYLDCDQKQDIKLDVHEAKEVEDHPQWNISSDEEGGGESEDEGISSEDQSSSDGE